MNKQELIDIFLNTACGEDWDTYKAWRSAINKLGLVAVQNINISKMICVKNKTDDIYGLITDFSVSFVKDRFPTLEQFLSYGDKLQDGDFVFDGLEKKVFEILGGQRYWNAKENGDCGYYVLFAQCWLDEKYNIHARDSDEFFGKELKVYPEKQQSKCHPRADMIKAKLDNMDLVVLTKDSDNYWCETKRMSIGNDVCYDYFPCLPKHKEAVLNCLNGGESQVFFDGWYKALTDGGWYCDGWYMREDYESRIKPKQPIKAKRWIIITADGNELYSTTEPTAILNSSKIREIEIEL